MNSKVNPFNIAIVAYCLILDAALAVFMGVYHFIDDMALSYVLEIALVVILGYLSILANRPLKRTEPGRAAAKISVIALDIIAVHMVLGLLIYLHFTNYLTSFILLMLVMFLPIIMGIIARKKLDEAIFRKEVLVFAIVMIALAILVPVFMATLAGTLFVEIMQIPGFLIL